MKKTLNLSLLFIFFSISICFTQSYSHLISTSTESTPDSVIFQNCLDSINKYVYLDSRKIKPYMAACEQMLANNSSLTNRHRFEFVIECIYNEYNNNNAMGAFKIIETNKNLLNQPDILAAQKTKFDYLEGFTLLELGEIEDAQRRFYDLLAFAKANKDTITIVQVNYSLGLLFTYQNDFETAEKYFMSFYHVIPKNKISYILNTNLEVVKMYLKSGQIDKAQYYTEKSLGLTDSLNIADLKLDFLLLQGEIDLKKGNFKNARKAHKEASMIAKKMEVPYYQQKCKQFYAEILTAQKRFEEALLTYDELIIIEEKERTTLTTQLSYYQMAYQMAERTNDHEKGFRYVLKANEIKDSLAIEEQRQKSQYLTIKFNAEQKEKDNALLTAQVLQKKFQNKLLYALIAIFLIGILFLIAAFLQKRKYNNQLKEEVDNRTRELKTANKELNEFNKILSHDLREPLRSIVGFSTMATKALEEDKNKSKQLIEYLSYVNKSGKQLYKLIEDVSTFQTIGGRSSKELEVINLNFKINSIITSTPYLSQNKNALVKFTDLPKIYGSDALLSSIFKNLIENGLKFNQSANPTVRIEHEQRDGFHYFLVKDNGIGIAPEFHKRIFGMFKRLHNRGTYEGSGLGLNIVKKSLTYLGGDISIIASEKNTGSIFQVRLPIVKPVTAKKVAATLVQ